ncbi:MAG TPA: thioesterase family protein [Acidimicrobiales bacterium]|nr:thioesterase family protein [Acidimicrobiales bacterium]
MSRVEQPVEQRADPTGSPTVVRGAPPRSATGGNGTGGTAFGRQMAVTTDPGTPGRYVADVDPRWNCPVVPQGGIMAALAAAAMSAEVGDPDQRLRTLTTVFAAPVPAGRVTVDVTVLRRGRTMTQATATVRADGEAGHTTVAVFGSDRPGFEFTDLTMPAVPSPDACPSFRDPPPPGVELEERPPVSFWEHVEGRPALGHAPWEDYVPASSARGSWVRFDEPPLRPDGTLDPLAVVALADLMPGSVGERMGPGQPDWWGPSTDLTVHLFEEPRSDWLLSHQSARRATAGYASVESALWDATGALVAHATQVMFLTFPQGPPVGDARFPVDQRR